MDPEIIYKRKKGHLDIIKKLGKIFPKSAIFGKDFSPSELEYLEGVNLIERIPHSLVTGDKEIGRTNSFRLTLFGLRYLNEFTLRKINRNVLILTGVLVVIGLISLIL